MVRANKYVVTIKDGDLSKALKNIGALDVKTRLAAVKALRSGTKRIAAGARRRVSSDTGALKRSIRGSVKADRLTGIVIAAKPHAHLVEFGAKAAVAKPDKKKVLRAPLADGYRYFPKAKIPARSPKPFMIPAFKAEERNIINEFSKGIKNASTT